MCGLAPVLVFVTVAARLLLTIVLAALYAGDSVRIDGQHADGGGRALLSAHQLFSHRHRIADGGSSHAFISLEFVPSGWVQRDREKGCTRHSEWSEAE